MLFICMGNGNCTQEAVRVYLTINTAYIYTQVFKNAIPSALRPFPQFLDDSNGTLRRMADDFTVPPLSLLNNYHLCSPYSSIIFCGLQSLSQLITHYHSR